jgi:hypothetical protein
MGRLLLVCYILKLNSYRTTFVSRPDRCQPGRDTRCSDSARDVRNVQGATLRLQRRSLLVQISGR